jgi:uncharacterized MAPEG superfamily protein
MPVEIKVLGFAALLQFAQFLLMAVPANIQLGAAYTLGNRDVEKRATGMAGRLNRALENHFEALILFAIAVIVVVLGDASSPFTENCAWVYLIGRILYVPAYASGVYMVRSLIWSVSFAATLAMLWSALF